MCVDDCALQPCGVVAVTIGALVRMLRERRSWSQGELARRADVPQATVSKLERGLRGVRDSTLAKIAQALDTTVVEMKRQAGLLSAEELNRVMGLPSVVDAVNADPNLSDDQREAILVVYYAFVPAAKRSR